MMSAGQRKLEKKIRTAISHGLQYARKSDITNDFDIASVIIITLRNSGFDVVRKERKDDKSGN